MYFTAANTSSVNKITLSLLNQASKTAAAQLAVSISSYKSCLAGIDACLHFDI